MSPKSLCAGGCRHTLDVAPCTARKTVSLHRTGSSWSDRDYKHSQFDDVWRGVAVVETVAVTVAAVVVACASAETRE